MAGVLGGGKHQIEMKATIPSLCTYFVNHGMLFFQGMFVSWSRLHGTAIYGNFSVHALDAVHQS